MSAKIAGLPIQKEWTVTGVREGNEVDNPNGPGTLKAFYVDFDGAPDVYWRRKMPATVEVGQTYFGTISESDHGPRFKKENPGQGGGGGGGGGGRTSTAGGREWKSESQYDPEKVARMGRAHAQGMAIELCKAMGGFDGKSGDQIVGKLTQWTDFFQADVDAAGQKAAQGAGSAGRTATPPGGAAASDGSGPASAQASEEGEDPEWVLKVCEDAGLSAYPAGKLARFIEKLKPEQQKRAVGGLCELDTQGETLTRLKSAYEEHEGEPLPESDPQEDDIPF